MSTRSGKTGRQREQPGDRVANPGPTRDDLVLALIPVVFLTTVLLAELVGIPLRTALIGASLVGTVAVADALFLNPPTRRG
ncbi:hypothetical protein [Haloarcula halophila]|uniref:hypothetical protein n=1 Tax=Haloarcula TaxID=2237 RepID=UPI0023E38C29|nr:hypothetical protein [Halomicroarcula sp. DFY41]